MNKLVLGAFALLGCIWGSNFIFMKWAAAVISPAQVVLLRVLFGFVPVLLFALAKGVLQWRQMRQLHHFFVMALLATAVYYFAFAKGAALLPSSIAGMLSGAIPLFAFVVALVFLRSEPVNRRTLLGLGLGFGGVLLIARPWSAAGAGIDPNGVLAMIAGSLSIGASFVYARLFLADQGISPVALSAWQLGCALLMLLCVTDLHGIGAITGDHAALAGLVFGLGLAGTGLAFILYYFIVQQLGALKAASVTYLPPVVAMLIGCLLAGEPLLPASLAAMALILGGVVVLQSGKQQPRT